MADEVDFLVRIEANIDALRAELNTAGGAIQRLGTNATVSGGMIRNALSFAGGQILTQAINAIGQAFISASQMGWEFNSSMQQNLASFTTLLNGSEAAARGMVDTLVEMAATTPFETIDLTNAAKTLMGFGVAAKDVVKDLQMLGDASLGNKDRFQGLTLAFAQVQAQGRLMGQDVLQMVSNGFNPLQAIAKSTGKTMAELKVEMEKGAISSKMVTEAFVQATSKGGLFYQAMDKQSKTFSGQMSTLADNVKLTLGQIMRPLFEKISNEVLPKVIEKLGQLQKTFEETGSIVIAFGKTFGASEKDIKAFSNSVNDVISVIKDVYNIFMFVWPAIKFVASTAIDFIFGKVIRLIEVLSGLATGLKSLASGNVNGALNALAKIVGVKTQEIGKSFDGMSTGIASGLLGNINALKKGTGSMLGSLIPVVAEVADKVVEETGKISKKVEDEAKKVKDEMVSNLNTLGDAITVALKKKWDTEEKMQLSALNKQSDNLRMKTDANIAQYDRELIAKLKSLEEGSSAEIEALQGKIDIINKTTDIEDKAIRKSDVQEKINEKRRELDAAILLSRSDASLNAKSNEERLKTIQDRADKVLEIEKELNEMTNSQSRDAIIEARNLEIEGLRNSIATKKKDAESKKLLLQQESERKIQHEQNMLAMTQDGLARQMDGVKLHYEGLTTEENTQAVARYLALDKNNAELITLLSQYNPKWQDAGASFGQKLLDGLESKRSSIQSAISSMVSMVAQVDNRPVQGPSISDRTLKGFPGFANGTDNAPGGIAMVGERGPELVNLPRGSQVTPNNAIGGIVINIGTLVGSGGMNELVDIISGKMNKKYANAIGGGFY